MALARAHAPRTDNPLADAPQPRFRLVSSAPEETDADARSDERLAREAYMERLAAAPERVELESARPQEGERRTVRVNGRPRVASAHAAPAGERPGPLRLQRGRLPSAAQFATNPDRVALWAVMLGLFLAFMAAATSIA